MFVSFFRPDRSVQTQHFHALLALLFGLMLFAGCSKDPAAEEKSEISIISDDADDDAVEIDCPPGAVAMVDDRVITREEADRRAVLNLKSEGVEESHPDFEKRVLRAHKGAVDFLIQSYVLQDEASGTVEIPAASVETELLRWKMRVPSKEDWDKFLAKNEVTEEGFREILLLDLRIRRMMEQAAVRDVPTPTPDEARQFFETQNLAFAWPHRVKYDEIHWKAGPEVPEASRAEARAGMEELRKKMDADPAIFDQILNGTPTTLWAPVGLRPAYANVTKLPQVLQDALHQLVQGELSPVIEGDVGYSIVRIVSLRQSFDSARQEILDSLFADRAQLNLQEWLELQKRKRRVRICDVDYYNSAVPSATGEAAVGSQP